MSTPVALIIEDDEDLSQIFTQAMSAAGFVTETIRDGRIALQRLAEINPSVVLLDLHLPHIPGENLLKLIRSEKRMQDTRVVITTADTIAAELLNEQADFVLVKPISYAQLRDLARRLNPDLQTGQLPPLPS
ncbi:MAG: response regulator [Chloroflexota bacterium]